MIRLPDWTDPISVGKFVVRNALQEDVIQNDAATDGLSLKGDDIQVCMVVARERMLVAGWFLVDQVFQEVAEICQREVPECIQLIEDGSIASSGEPIGYIRGAAEVLLKGERVALNLLCRLSGIATLTSEYVQAVHGTGVEILDTRKTTPCLRAIEKYAVRIGGGVNHRSNLAELAMIKDNHIVVAGGIGKLHAVIDRIRERERGLIIEIEVDSLDQLRCVLDEEPERILLDNMSPEALRDAAEIASGSGCYLEASGAITLENVREVAETGVDGISSGALTHSAAYVDIGFDWEKK